MGQKETEAASKAAESGDEKASADSPEKTKKKLTFRDKKVQSRVVVQVADKHA